MQEDSLVFASEREAQAKAARLRALGVEVVLRPHGDGWALEIDRADRDHLTKLEALSVATPESSAVVSFTPTPLPSKRRLGKPGLLLAGAAAIGLVVIFAPTGGPAVEPHGATNDGRVALSDDDGDAVYDRAVILDRGRPTAIWRDGDGVFDRFLTFDVARGTASELVDADGDGFPERVDHRGPPGNGSHALTGT